MLTETQLKERMNGVGGSDMPIILGISQYKTPYQLFLEKTGQLSCVHDKTPLQEWGDRLEPLIRLKFQETHNVFVKESEDAIIHPEHNFLRANLDGFIPEWNAVLEIKSANSFMKDQWGEEESDDIPFAYLCQVIHYVACTNAEKAIIAVLIGGYDYREYTYLRDAQLENHIISKAKDFWECVKNDTPPALINVDDARLLYPFSMDKKSIVASEEYEKMLSDFNENRKEQKKLVEMENEYKLNLMQYMGDSEYLTDSEGRPLVSWKSNKNGSRTFRLKTR